MSVPQSIIIVGGGAFGLSTALSISKRHPKSKVTLIEASSVIPNPHGSSVDMSRIIRADYAHAPYARLAVEALDLWRTDEWGGDGRYMQNGLLSVFREDGSSGHQYARKSFETLKAMEGSQVEFLSSREDVLRVAPAFGKAMEIDAGYINWGAGWADAEAGIRYAKKRIEKEGKVTLLSGTVKQLIYDHNDQNITEGCRRVTGVMLSDQSVLHADLTVLATGAWTPKLVDMQGTVRATGQILLYIQITPEEQECLSHQPTIFNWTNGFFIIPPRNNLLKIARHGHGYLNPTMIPTIGGNGERMQVSLPEIGLPVPLRSQEACRAALRELLPDLAERPFTNTRICWYTDTPNGDFIITYHPRHPGLFLATGGSGHGYKFLPVIGDKIVDAIEGRLEVEYQELWRWPEGVEDSGGDGSRFGEKDVNLMQELANDKKSSRIVL